VVFHFILVPASADAKQEPSLARLVDRGDELRGLDRVALLHQQHAGAEFDGSGRERVISVWRTGPSRADKKGSETVSM